MSDKLYQKFFSDPDWALVEDIIEKHIEPLKDMNTLDLTQPAEHLKAEVVGRVLAYNSLADFLNESGIVQRKIEKIQNPFR
jgi:hypothetical protein